MTQIPKIKQQLNNQNYTNENSHSKISVLTSLRGGQPENVKILGVLTYIEETSEQLKNQFNINTTFQKI